MISSSYWKFDSKKPTKRNYHPAWCWHHPAWCWHHPKTHSTLRTLEDTEMRDCGHLSRFAKLCRLWPLVLICFAVRLFRTCSHKVIKDKCLSDIIYTVDLCLTASSLMTLNRPDKHILPSWNAFQFDDFFCEVSSASIRDIGTTPATRTFL